MLLTKITLNDYGVYRGRNEFDFRTTQERPIVLCGGGNGAGKTTLFESIMICLYGKESFEKKVTQKQYEQAILRSIHRYLGTKKSADEASIMVQFQYAHEGKISEYQIMRMWQNNDGRIDEKFTIKKQISEDKFAELDSIEENQWQTFLNQLIPKGIAKLFFFDGEKIQTIAEDGNEDVQIKSSFDVLLGLDLIEQLKTDLSLSALRNSDGETEKILAEIDKLTNEKKESDDKIGKLIEKKAEKNSEIEKVQQRVILCEEKVAKFGGGYYEKREQLKEEKSQLTAEIQAVEKEISQLCADILPFSLVPDQLEQIKNKIETDHKTLEQSFEKKILEENFEEILKEIKLKEFLTKLDVNEKKEISDIFNKKLESIGKNEQTIFNLSISDMQHILKLIEKIDGSFEKTLQTAAKTYNDISDRLEKVQVAFESVPKDDDIGPIITELQKENRELGRLENEFKHLEDLEMQEKSLVTILNSKIRNIVKEKHQDKRRVAGMEYARKIQIVLDEYSAKLRDKKLEHLQRYITDGLEMLLHKKDFIDKVSIDKETFEVKLYKGEDEITKSMLSKGELQMYATAVVWGLAKTSGRPLPFMIDTPLARLDEENRDNLIEKFYPYASHQMIIFSTNSEINAEFYPKLEPFVESSFVIKYDSDKGKTVKHDSYFFDSKGEKVIEV